MVGSCRVYHNRISGRGATSSMTGLLMYFQNSRAKNRVTEAATADRPPNRPNGINVTARVSRTGCEAAPDPPH